MFADEMKVGQCERCNKKKVPVIACGYYIGFLCGDCYKVIHAIDWKEN